jgi:hypothetical protein
MDNTAKISIRDQARAASWSILAAGGHGVSTRLSKGSMKPIGDS